MSLWTYRATVERVVDGDTVDLAIDLGFRITHRIRVRLAGVDTPEVYGVSKESFEYLDGIRASEFTKSLLPVGKECLVTTGKTGKYGRWIATIVTEDGGGLTNVNDRLIEKGWGNG